MSAIRHGRPKGGLRPRDAERLATQLKVLSDPARVRLLSLIAAQGTDGVCCGDLADPLGISQPTVSHHLKVLYEAKLVERERDGVWVCYRAVPDGIEALRAALASLLG